MGIHRPMKSLLRLQALEVGTSDHVSLYEAEQTIIWRKSTIPQKRGRGSHNIIIVILRRLLKRGPEVVIAAGLVMFTKSFELLKVNYSLNENHDTYSVFFLLQYVI